MKTPKNLISISEVKEQMGSYEKNVRSKMPEVQTKSVWFSYNDLKEYMAYIEKHAADKEIGLSGIRFYFIASNDAKRSMSLALCPTCEMTNTKGEKEQVSFDPIYSEKHKPASLKKLMENPEKAVKGSSVLNRGVKCPNICPEEE